ncbi:SGNH/GDSL hydrolase family protein [Virgibacillus kekensis]|uniref:SGNH/GDSL hydrolase family protein n=1 Tax=Virgibacillus kekensis TaxID=202261 RepID=A0ABV9DK14_9BACI
MRKIFKLAVLTIVMSLLFTTGVSAKEDNGKKSFVALGDSIPFGYNLSNSNNNATARVAFPYLIGKEGDLRVRNLGVPGWTTGQLLEAVKNDEKYRQALHHADYVSLTIGSNDLLDALAAAGSPNGGGLMEEIGKRKTFENISNIVKEVNQLSDAKVVVYNVYNPFPAGTDLHNLGDTILPLINGKIFATVPTVMHADAYTAFGDNQAIFILGNDIHPTEEGQEILSAIGLEALGLTE